MATFDEIKHKVHDASGCDNPANCAWELLNGVWYPALGGLDLEAQIDVLRREYEQSAKNKSFFFFIADKAVTLDFFRWLFRIELDTLDNLPYKYKELYIDLLHAEFIAA